MSFVKRENMYVVKGDYEIPLAIDGKQSDSMLNCDLARFNKVLSKRMTLSGKARKVSRFESFFNSKKQKISTTQRLIRGLRHNTKMNTKKELAKRKISFTESTNNIQENFGINHIILKIKSKSAINLCRTTIKFDSSSDVSEACKDDNTHNNKESGFTIIAEENSDCSKNEPRKRVKARSRLCFNRVQHRFKTLKNYQQVNFNSIHHIPKQINHKHLIEADKNLFNYSSDEDIDEDDENENNNSITEVEIDELSCDLFKSKDSLYKILNSCDSSNAKGTKSQEILKDKFIMLISTSEGINTFYDKYFELKSDGKLKQFFKNVNLAEIALSIECSSLEELITRITANPDDADFIYSLFDSATCWVKLISSKYGKNIVEYFMKHFYSDEPSKHSTLFNVIDHNFVEFAQSNYTTFVVQAYISYFARDPPFKKIMKNFEQLSLTRNGVFVVIAGLKGYKQHKLKQLIDKIISNSEYLCTSKYASTMMEYVFKNFGHLACEKFIQKKLSFLYGKYYDNYIRYYRKLLW